MKKIIDNLAAVRPCRASSVRIKFCVLLAVGMLSGCAKALPAQIKNMLFSQKRNTGIVDLTRLSATMVYAEVFNMMVEPENYVGKTIKMNGLFYVYPDEKKRYVYVRVSHHGCDRMLRTGDQIPTARRTCIPRRLPRTEYEHHRAGDFLYV